MNVTKSSEWKWVTGMENTRGEICIGMEDGDLCFADTGMGTVWDASENYVPNLDDPATQGAIVFGIFEPLGIFLNAEEGDGERWTYDWGVRTSLFQRNREFGERIEGVPRHGSMAGAIRALFSALDLESSS